MFFGLIDSTDDLIGGGRVIITKNGIKFFILIYKYKN